jgi:hypothetical protein
MKEKALLILKKFAKQKELGLKTDLTQPRIYSTNPTKEWIKNKI